MNASRPIDAVVAGYLGVDMAPGFVNNMPVSPVNFFRPGKLIETRGLHFSLGGAVANTGLAMKRFGCQVELMGCVGRDPLGDWALARLAELATTRGIRRLDSVGTAYGIVLAPLGMDRLFLEDPGCNRVFTADDIDFDMVSQSRLFHLGYPPLMEALWRDDAAELKTLLDRVHRTGTTVSLDMALPDAAAPAGKLNWRKILSETLKFVDIFVPSIEELLFMLDKDMYHRLEKQAADGNMVDSIPAETVEDMAANVLAMGPRVLLLKAGHRGAYLRTVNTHSLQDIPLALNDPVGCPDGCRIGPYPVDADSFCNASGAGDCAVAGFLTALLNGKNLKKAGACAMLAGRDNLYGTDALSGLKTWSGMTEWLDIHTNSCRIP